MASGFNVELKNAILNYYFGYASSPYATLYVGLCTSVADNGTVTGEPSIGTNGYARASIANNGTTVFSSATTGSKTNANAIVQFPQCTGTAWTNGTNQTFTTFFITEQQSATGSGVALCWGDLTSNITIAVGDQPTFNTSQLTISIT